MALLLLLLLSVLFTVISTLLLPVLLPGSGRPEIPADSEQCPVSHLPGGGQHTLNQLAAEEQTWELDSSDLLNTNQRNKQGLAPSPHRPIAL